MLAQLVQLAARCLGAGASERVILMPFSHRNDTDWTQRHEVEAMRASQGSGCFIGQDYLVLVRCCRNEARVDISLVTSKIQGGGGGLMHVR